MSAAVQMLTDRSIIATWQLYCTKDPVVTIIVRDIKDPSPNASRAPSYSVSLGQRRSISGGTYVPEIPLQTAPRELVGGLDLATGENLADFPEAERVTITLENGGSRTFSREYITCWIDSQLQDGKVLTDISIQSLDNGEMVSTKLTREIWERSLVRGPWKADFAPLWQRYVVAQSERESAIAELLRIKANFAQSCQDFIHDLRTFSGNKGSRNRLDSTGHEFFLGAPYFDGETVEKILGLRTTQGTLQEVLQALSDKRVGEAICASHDLAPIFESVLGIAWNKDTGKTVSSQFQMRELELSAEGSRISKLTHKSSKLFSDVFGGKRRTKEAVKEVAGDDVEVDLLGD